VEKVGLIQPIGDNRHRFETGAAAPVFVSATTAACEDDPGIVRCAAVLLRMALTTVYKFA
jgi:hypothetical protein